MEIIISQLNLPFTVALIVLAAITTGHGSTSHKRVCFYRSWSGSGETRFTPEDIDPSLCSHLISTYSYLADNRIHPGSSYSNPHDSPKDIYRKMNNLKIQNPNMKTLISVGGWNLEISKLSNMLSTPRTRRVFIRSVISFLREHRFDGIDLHFQYPGSRGSPLLDKYRFSKLCQEMKAIMNTRNRKYGTAYFLIVTGPAEKTFIKRGYDVRRISRYAEFINIMTYDLHGGWEERTGHQSTLFPGKEIITADRELNVEWAADYWHKLGAPKNKIVIGMPFYGRGFTLADPTSPASGIGSEVAGPSRAGRLTRQGGFLAFYEICQMLRAGARRHWLMDQGVPYLTLGSQWVGYDDRTSLTEKVRWLKRQGFGGWMAWSIEFDDFSGTFCQVGNFPLLTAMNDALSANPRTPAPPPPIEIKEPTQRPTEASTVSDTFCRDKNDGYYPHPSDCTRYIMCVWEATFVKTCPTGLTFNIEEQTCDTTFGMDEC